MLREPMVLYFRGKGCPVDAFGSAEEALPALETRPPDIVICDQSLPGMDGLTFLKRVGVLHPGAGKILVCSYRSMQVAEEMKRAGIDGYLMKPFPIEELEQVLNRLPQRRSDGEKSSNGVNGDLDGELV